MTSTPRTRKTANKRETNTKGGRNTRGSAGKTQGKAKTNAGGIEAESMSEIKGVDDEGGSFTRFTDTKTVLQTIASDPNAKESDRISAARVLEQMGRASAGRGDQPHTMTRGELAAEITRVQGLIAG